MNFIYKLPLIIMILNCSLVFSMQQQEPQPLSREAKQQKMKERIKKEAMRVDVKTGMTELMHTAGSEAEYAPKKLQDLIDNGALVNATDKNEMTALMHAFYSRVSSPNLTAAIEILLRKDANANITDKGGKTALIHALIRIKHDEIGFIQCATPKDEIAQILERIYTKPLRLLLAKMSNAAINIQENDRWHPRTALMYAAEIRVPPFTQMLLEHGADANIYYIDRNLGDIFTALRFARNQTNNQEVIQLLEEKTGTKKNIPQPAAAQAPQTQAVVQVIPQANFLARFAFMQRLQPYIQRCTIL